MHMLFDPNILENIQTKNELPLRCGFCSQTFYLTVRVIKNHLQKNKKFQKDGGKFCSRKCSSLHQENHLSLRCAQCATSFTRKKSISEYSSKKSHNSLQFCSKSCSCRYRNLHKTTGIRRSKLEIWIENQLSNNYQNLNMIFNGKESIDSELDIYIPSLSLAFELNGIVHYEPIYGSDKLSLIKNNDNRKFQACLEKQIELVILDTSKETYFKEEKSKKYLDIITSIIDKKLCP